MPRLVVLEHDSPRGLHWDFMLETAGDLWTWAVPQPCDSGQPDHASGDAASRAMAVGVLVDRLPDHRRRYLDYEGPISQNRGMVTRWDEGTYRILRRGPGYLRVAVSARRLRGVVELQESDQPGKWRFTYQPAAEPE